MKHQDRPKSPTQIRREAFQKKLKAEFDEKVADGSIVIRKMTDEDRRRFEAARSRRRGG